jgi:hypothetical protein
MKFNDFYELAKLGGEGWGMAYEYRAKWKILERYFGERKIEKVLIAGLPEKYGLSLDFLMWARKRKVYVLVLDERERVVRKARRVVKKKIGGYREWIDIKKRGLLTIDTAGRFDLVLSCEVLQRISKKLRGRFLRRCLIAAKRGAFFVPNSGNENHAKISKLEGLSLEELYKLGEKAGWERLAGGYIDMPPFPPGLELEKEKRENRLLKTVLPVGLEVWVRTERFWPGGLKKKNAHLVYVVLKK